MKYPLTEWHFEQGHKRLFLRIRVENVSTMYQEYPAKIPGCKGARDKSQLKSSGFCKLQSTLENYDLNVHLPVITPVINFLNRPVLSHVTDP